MHNTREHNLWLKITRCESNLRFIAAHQGGKWAGGPEARERWKQENTEAIAKAKRELAELGLDEHGNPLRGKVRIIRRGRPPAAEL